MSEVDDLLIKLDNFEKTVSEEEPKLTGVGAKMKDEFHNFKERALKDADARVVADRIAKGAPVITKGTLSAIVAFKKKDYMAGSAALMDICSGTAMLFWPPTGAIVGAFFNSIGQILSVFVPQEPSLEDKIEKLLEHFESEEQKRNINAVGHSISSYTTSLTTKCVGTTSNKGIADILAMPLTSETEADDFIVEMKGLIWGLEQARAAFDVPAFTNWQVAAYLENQTNWRKEGWPEVLGIWCRTYINLLTANMMLYCLAPQKTLDGLINETQETNKNSLPNLTKHTKHKCHTALLNLKVLENSLRNSWGPNNKEMLKIVQAIRPAAKESGTYAHVGIGYKLYTAPGSGSKDALKWKYQDNTEWLNRISILIPNAEKDSFTPKYEVFTCEYYHPHKIGCHTLDSVKNTLSNRTQVISPRPNETFLDVSAMVPIEPGSMEFFTSPPHPDSKAYVTALVIENNKTVHMDLYVINENNESKFISREADRKQYAFPDELVGAKDVRVLYLPPTTLPDDPDADAMVDNMFFGASHATPPGPPLLAQKTKSFLSYSGFRDDNKIYVVTWDYAGSGPVEGPENWTSYNGIEVDPYYLWVFGKGGIACATHASIIKCRQGKITRPSWIRHDFDKQVFPSAPEVTSLYPCADETLVANVQGNIYTADYEIDRKSRRIVTSSWVKRGGNAKQVIKMPIPCWSMLESLRANLELG
jgi:hypothetical protein